MSLFAEGKFFNKASAESGGSGDQHNLGWYATQSALETAHPTAADGDWAIVGSTDTVWVWDSDTNAWKDTDQKGQVTSVNGQTGDVVLDLLPDQTGNAGKFLTTDGTDASWSDKPLVNNTTGTDSVMTGLASGKAPNSIVITPQQYNYNSSNGKSVILIPRRNINGFPTSEEIVVIGSNTYAGSSKSVVIGPNASGSLSSVTAVGYGAAAVGQRSIAVGSGATCAYSATGAIQIGSTGSTTTNNDANTLKVANNNGNFELMSADGTIPKERLVNAVSKPSTMPELTVAGWSNNTQTVTVTGVTATNTVFVSPAPASASDYASAGIVCTAQGTDSLTFTCTTVPTNAITVNVVIMG